MQIEVREMTLEEAPAVINYFHASTPEHLEMLGVDPTRLPPAKEWLEGLEREFGEPISRRRRFFVSWIVDDGLAGFSSCDKIRYGEQANMHLHVLNPTQRQLGIGTKCVRQSAELYFEKLQLKRLFCEPNAFNTGPNRTLQKAGFAYVKTHMTNPGPLNYRQAVTRWVIER